MRVTPRLLLLVLLFTLTGYLFPTFAQTESPVLTSIRKAGRVKVAVASLPPYIVVSPSGEVMGSSIDLQNMALKAMGLPALTPVLAAWDAMVPGLLAHQFDYLGGGLNITEERCKVALLSTPYYASQAGLYVPPGNPKHLTSLADVARRPDMKVAVLPGESAYNNYAKEQGVKASQMMTVPDNQAGVAAVIGARVDAFVVGQFSIPDPEQKGVAVIVDKQSPVFGSGLAFRKEDGAFRDSFNAQLNMLIRNGTLQKLYERYGITNGNTMAQLLAKFSKAGDVVPSCK
ncbi:putative Amino acid ABC transporter substrate-binding protein [Bradyrhizobium vignae]|uniref:Putative Amino acid ABC transporter substrate-binding protein n=2 Tax=Bradyrhizobium vignae TaxID=1549949 RepID=A0A2U3QAA0_9BRAD|nr:putative Amino acid ABC transporter substrate-binding protein [Bradyrhizobium vignae]